MKKLYFSLFSVLLFSVANAQNPIPNPGAETWVGSPLNPTSWDCNFAGQPVTVTQVSPGHNASLHAAQGTVVVSGGTTYPPNLFPGTSSGVAITQRYYSFQFYYKCDLKSGDIFEVFINLLNPTGQVVGQKILSITTTTANWIYVNTSIDSVHAASGLQTPAKANINMTIIPSSGSDAHLNSYYIVDDLVLNRGTVGIEEITENSNVNVYPNPVRDRLFIDGNAFANSTVKFKLSDALGQVVLQRESSAWMNGTRRDELNVEGLSRGLYFLRIESDGKSLVKRVIIE